jgi:hypothetical protein
MSERNDGEKGDHQPLPDHQAAGSDLHRSGAQVSLVIATNDDEEHSSTVTTFTYTHPFLDDQDHSVTLPASSHSSMLQAVVSVRPRLYFVSVCQISRSISVVFFLAGFRRVFIESILRVDRFPPDATEELIKLASALGAYHSSSKFLRDESRHRRCIKRH